MPRRFAHLGLLLLAWIAASVATPQTVYAQATSQRETWLPLNGEASLTFNPDALRALGIRVESVHQATGRVPGVPGVRYDVARFDAPNAGSLEVFRSGARVLGFGNGALAFAGGLALAHENTSIDLRGFRLRAIPGDAFGIEIADARGVAWFTADHAHAGIDGDANDTIWMRHMNLRLSPHFADAIGDPSKAGYPVGGFSFRMQVANAGMPQSPGDPPCTSPWPGAGRDTDIQMIYEPNGVGSSGFADSVIARRCALPPVENGTACTAASTNGEVVITPDSSLRNVGDTGVAWYGKFQGNHPPYNNDQHPYLIWNLYRVDAAGRIKQIGASAVKHAFYTVNWNCGCAPGNVIHPTCEDTYSFSSNDNSPDGDVQQYQALAPRSEIVPNTALWGRCGSVFDANCDGAMDAGSGAENLYQYRLLATERDMLPPLSDNAEYFLEYWYVVRDDQNIYDSMAYRRIWPRKNGAVWSIGLTAAGGPVDDGNFFQGPVINRWIDPVTPPSHSMNKEIVTPLGRVRVAVKATNAGSGRWRYEYAVMNFDYAHAAIDPAHPSSPNLRVLSNHGFSRFRVGIDSGTSVTALRFDDLDDDTANNWVATTGGERVAWNAPAGNTLDWGTLYHFEFTADAFPSLNGSITLVGAATAVDPEIAYVLGILGPPSDTIFANGFDS